MKSATPAETVKVVRRLRSKNVLLIGALVIAAVVAAVQIGQRLDESQTSARPTPTAATPESVTPTPAATNVPVLAAGRPCAPDPGIASFGETVFVDLDRDGSDEAIAPKARLRAPGNVTVYSVMVSAGECGWREVGVLHQGTSEYLHDGVAHRWTCVGVGTGSNQSVRLVQIIAEASPDQRVSLQQFEVHDGVLKSHQPTVMTSTLASYEESRVADGASLGDDCAAGSGNKRYATARVKQCGGVNWTIEVPIGWETPLVGADACSVFSIDPMAWPCNCDAVPEISVRMVENLEQEFVGEPQAAFRSKGEVDGYRATLTEHVVRNVGVLEQRTRSYVVDIGDGYVVMTAASRDSQLTWEGLSAALDLVVDGTSFFGFPPAAALLLNQPNLDPSRFLFLEPKGRYALYGGQIRGAVGCSSEVADHLFRLDIGNSTSSDLRVESAGFLAVGNMMNFSLDESGTGLVRMRCLDEGERRQTDYELTFSEDGAVTTAIVLEDSELPDDRFYRSNDQQPFVTPDGRYRYAVADDPMGRIASSCGSGGGTQPAKTLLTYGPDGIDTAFRDVGLVGNVGRMVFGQNNVVIWEQNQCHVSNLFAGRIDETGHIVDRHSLGYRNPGRWILNEQNQIVSLGFEQINYEADMLDEVGQPFENTSFVVPSLEFFNVDRSPGWVMSSTQELVVLPESVGMSFDGGAEWFLGPQINGLGECPGRTVYAEHLDGFVRVLDAFTPIHGDVVEVATSPIQNGVRAIAVRAACVGDGSVSSVWFGVEDERFVGGPLRLREAELSAIDSIEDVRIEMQSNESVDVVIRAIGPGGDDIEMVLEAVES